MPDTPNNHHEAFSLRDLEERSRKQYDDHRELENTVHDVDSRLKTIEAQQSTLIENDKVLFSKLDVIQNAVTTVRAAGGRISGSLILTLIATITPIVGGAAMLGHIFLTNNVASLQNADQAQSKATADLFLGAAEKMNENARLTEKINDHLDAIRTSRWSKDDHTAYARSEVEPIESRAIKNEIDVARQDERLTFLEAGYARERDPMHKVAEAIQANTDVLRELTKTEQSENNLNIPDLLRLLPLPEPSTPTE